MIEKIKEILSSFLLEHSLYLYHIEYVKEGKDMVLRVFVDRVDGYITSDECEMVSNYLSDCLDTLDPIENEYILEVSSPGMDRELITKEHFDKYIGELVDVTLKEPSNIEYFKGEKVIPGELISYTDNVVTIKATIDTKKKNRKPGQKVSPKALINEEFSFNKDDIKKVNLQVIF